MLPFHVPASVEVSTGADSMTVGEVEPPQAENAANASAATRQSVPCRAYRRVADQLARYVPPNFGPPHWAAPPITPSVAPLTAPS